VAYPRPVPEAVFESGPDYGGVTGLWALSAWPGDESHAAVVLSFVSGSRTLSIAGAHSSLSSWRCSADRLCRGLPTLDEFRLPPLSQTCVFQCI
jgi:hypothetical protein